jgi:UDP-N-acetylglucosamine--N-acetylmuramyl-(pentapeptide) pyrophosphoryl-undecaprenol N-acetylglucosamine transferase
VIAYYVHHHGRGHVMRALAISARLAEAVVFLSSLPAPAGLRSADRWVRLPLDVDRSAPVDVTAHGRLHWAPLHVHGLAQRSSRIVEVLAETRPRRVVVDCSVEVTLLCRLAGYPVTVVAQPGERDDPAHQLGYDVADQILAPWSARTYTPCWLVRHAERVHYTGAISRFDGCARPARTGEEFGLLLAGAGGDDVPHGALDELRSATTELRWRAAGGSSAWVDDIWPTLSAAAIVVTHAGQSALADVALSGAAAVVIAQDRPFGEQHATADALGRADIVVTRSGWPAVDEWPALLSRARNLDPRRWEWLEVRGAAGRAAEVLAA